MLSTTPKLLLVTFVLVRCSTIASYTEMRTTADDGVVISNHARTEWTWQHAVDRKGHEFQAVVIDFKRRKVLLKKEKENWVLPGCILHWRKYESRTDPSYLQAVVKHLTDWTWPVVFLRLLWSDEKVMQLDGMEQTMERLVALFELNADISKESKRYQWVDMSDCNAYHKVQEAKIAIEREIKNTVESFEPEKRFIWERCGWYVHAVDWMTEVLESHCGTSLMEAVVFEHSSSLGAIVRANTTQGTFFLRCYATLMNDVSRTKYLAQVVPDHVPCPVAVDDHRHMMITRDYGEALAPFCLPVDANIRVTISYARLQKKMTANCDELVAHGFPDFRVNVLRDELECILTNPAFLICEKRNTSTTATEQFQYFRANTDVFKERLHVLEESPIPPTLTHNNLGFSNVYEAKESYLFVDWVDGFVSHPFISNNFGLDESQYLREWRKYSSLEELREFYTVGQQFLSFVRFLLRLREVVAWEEPSATQSMNEALIALEAFNQAIRER